MRYVRAWEKTRREQNVLRHESEMDERKETLNDCYDRERNEYRVNAEVTRYLMWRMVVIRYYFDFFYCSYFVFCDISMLSI